MGEILETAEIRYAINGLLSLTPDAMPVLGETVEVANLWSAAAVWIKEGPGIAQLVAEWMTHGYPHLCDPHASDISRFYPHERTEHHIRARCAEHYNKTYGIVHPREQWASERGMRRSPFYAREEALGAVFFDARGWERPQWYESNAALFDRFPQAERAAPHEWDARWWSPITNAEHLAMRDSVGMVDLTAFNEFDIEGPGAVAGLQYVVVNNVDVPVGKSVYTPLLTPGGGFRGDLTIQRLGDEHFRVITGAFDGGRDQYWFRKHLPSDGSVTFTDRSQALCTLGLWGPNAAAVLGKVATPERQRRRRDRGRVAGRRSRTDRCATCSSTASRARCSASPTSARTGGRSTRASSTACASGTRSPPPARSSASCPSARRVRRHRADREGLPADGRRAGERVRPGRGRARPAEGEVGRLHRQGRLPRRASPRRGQRARRDAVHADDDATTRRRPASPATRSGGNEPILTIDGERIVDAKGRVSRVTTAGAAPSLDAYLLMAYLPPRTPSRAPSCA